MIKTLNSFDCDPDFRRAPKTKLYCWRCQKDLLPDQPKRWIHLINDFSLIVHPDSDEEYSANEDACPSNAGQKDDCGYFPVGMDCARRIGMEWTFQEHEGTVKS